MNSFKTILLLSAILFCTSLSAGAKGSWTNFTATNDIRDIDFQGPYVWCATAGGVVRWDSRDMSCRVFGPQDGLPDYLIRTIAAGADGTVLAGTAKDAARFDGTSWTRIPIKEEDKDYRLIYSLAAAPDSAIWCCGSFVTGISRWKNGVWEQFPGISGVGITVTPQGTVWAGSDVFLHRFDGDSWTKYPILPVHSDYSWRPAVGPNGDVWLAKPNLLYRFDGTDWLAYPLENTSFGSHGLACDREGVVWLGTTKGVYRFKDGFLPPYTEADGLPDDRVEAMRIAPDGTVWAGTLRGLARFDGEKWTVYRTDPMLTGDRGIDQVHVAPDGAVWMVGGLGLVRYDHGKWTEYTSKKDSLIYVASFGFSRATDGSFWVGSFYGISRFDGEKWTSYPMADEYPLYWNIPYVPTVSPDGSVWVAVPKGIRRYRNGEWTSFSAADGLPDAFADVIAIDQNGAVWLGNNGDIYRYNGISWQKHTLTDGKTPNRIERIIPASDGTVWVDAGAYYAFFRNKTWEVTPKKDTFKEDYVELIGEGPDGSIWARDGFTLYRYRDSVLEIMAYRMEFPNNHLAPHALKFAPDGSLWFGTGKGLMHWDGSAFTEYFMADGLAGEKVNSIDFSPDGAVWIGTDRGVSRFMPDTVVAVREKGESPAPFAITGNFPNPFNPSTTISFSLSAPGKVTLSVYDITGRKVRELISDRVYRPYGTYRIVWDGKDDKGMPASSGVYITHLRAGKHTASRRMVLVR
jgi:ligand-binding sensor domain-containing protein